MFYSILIENLIVLEIRYCFIFVVSLKGLVAVTCNIVQCLYVLGTVRYISCQDITVKFRNKDHLKLKGERWPNG